MTDSLTESVESAPPAGTNASGLSIRETLVWIFVAAVAFYLAYWSTE